MQSGLRRFADALDQDSMENPGVSHFLCHIIDREAGLWAFQSRRYRRVREVVGFMPDKHTNRLKEEIELVVATLPELVQELDGITPALPELGVKTRAEWLRKLADKEDAAAYQADKASEYAIAYGAPSKLYKPTHGGYPDASPSVPGHRCGGSVSIPPSTVCTGCLPRNSPDRLDTSRRVCTGHTAQLA